MTGRAPIRLGVDSTSYFPSRSFRAHSCSNVLECQEMSDVAERIIRLRDKLSTDIERFENQLNDAKKRLSKLDRMQSELDEKLRLLELPDSDEYHEDEYDELLDGSRQNGGNKNLALGHSPQPDRTSNVEIVSAAISGHYRTVAEIADVTGLTRTEIRNALNVQTLRRHLQKRETKSGMAYGMSPSAIQQKDTRPGMTDAVFEVIHSSDGPINVEYITEKVDGKTSTSANNIKAAVAATLSNLLKKGKIRRVSTGYYVSAFRTDVE